MKIRESGEDYLETILMIQKKNGQVRSIDICNELGYSKPTISVAMKNFREDGYITVNDDGSILLTEKGLKIAERLYERHRVIAKALIALGVDEDIAHEDSCKIEHDISEITFEKIKDFCAKHVKD